MVLSALSLGAKHLANKTDKLLLGGALLALSVALFAKSAGAQPKSTSNVQTATVGNRVYSIVRLGEGNYLVTLVSTGGVLESAPVNYTFSQVGPLGEIGPANKLSQLKQDLPSMGVKF